MSHPTNPTEFIQALRTHLNHFEWPSKPHQHHDPNGNHSYTSFATNGLAARYDGFTLSWQLTYCDGYRSYSTRHHGEIEAAKNDLYTQINKSIQELTDIIQRLD